MKWEGNARATTSKTAAAEAAAVAAFVIGGRGIGLGTIVIALRRRAGSSASTR